MCLVYNAILFSITEKAAEPSEKSALVLSLLSGKEKQKHNHRADDPN